MESEFRVMDFEFRNANCEFRATISEFWSLRTLTVVSSACCSFLWRPLLQKSQNSIRIEYSGANLFRRPWIVLRDVGAQVMQIGNGRI